MKNSRNAKKGKTLKFPKSDKHPNNLKMKKHIRNPEEEAYHTYKKVQH